MFNKMDRKKSHIRLEDLLKLKKAEQPSSEFWNRFDKQLKKRTLQTCIKEITWYQEILRVIHNQLGAIFTLNFLSDGCGRNMPWLGKITATTSVFVILLCITFYLQIDSIEDRTIIAAGSNVNLVESTSIKKIVEAGAEISASSNEFLAVVESEKLDKDYGVEIISIANKSEGVEFASDAIPIVIGDAVDYSDSLVNTVEFTKKSLSPYAQLANFAF